MSTTAQTNQKADIRDHLAAERTFLAWIRTGLALMGFGFVVARFGLFLQEFRTIQTTSLPPSTGLSLWFGTALILVGVIVDIVSTWNHVRLVRDLNAGTLESFHPSMQAVLVAIFLALTGLAMAIYLILIRPA